MYMGHNAWGIRLPHHPNDLVWHEYLLYVTVQADAKPIESCLSEGSIGMSRAIMEAIASGSVTTVVDVQRFVKCTLLAATSDFQASWDWPTIPYWHKFLLHPTTFDVFLSILHYAVTYMSTNCLMHQSRKSWCIKTKSLAWFGIDYIPQGTVEVIAVPVRYQICFLQLCAVAWVAAHSLQCVHYQINNKVANAHLQVFLSASCLLHSWASAGI